MKNQNSFSTPNSHSRHVKLFNPNASKVDQELSHIKSILTKHLMPVSFNNQVSESFSQLYSKIPRYDSSLNPSDPNRIGDFDPFWKQWILFREQISKLTDQSIIFYIQQFMNERFDEFNEIIEDLNTKPPQKVPIFREYEKSKKEIQTSFENLQQILLEQFDVDFDDDEDDSDKEPSEEKKAEQIKKTNARIETIIKNLQSQRSKIRQIKADVETKHRPFFINSSQDKELSKKQHERCVKIIDEILIKINGLPKQHHQFNSINNELSKAESKMRSSFPPNKVEVPPFQVQNNETGETAKIDQEGQLQEEEEEEFFEEEEDEVFLEEEEEEEINDQKTTQNEIEEDIEVQQRSSSKKQQNRPYESEAYQSPNKNMKASPKQAPLTPTPMAKSPFNSVNRNQPNQQQQQQQQQVQQKKQMPLTPQKKPPRLQLNSTNNNAIDDFDSNDRRNNSKQPQSAVAIKKLPHIKPLDLDDDPLVETFQGLSFSFSSSSSSSSDNEGSRSQRARSGKNSSTKSSDKSKDSHFSYRLFSKRNEYQKNGLNTDPSVHKGGVRSSGSYRSRNDRESLESNNGKGKSYNANNDDNSNDDLLNEKEVWSFQMSKTTPPSSPRGAPQPSHNQGSAARLRSKSPSSSIIRRRIINNHNSSSDEESNSARSNSSIINEKTSSAKKHSTFSTDNSSFHSVNGITMSTDSEIMPANKNSEFNTQPSVPVSPVRSAQQMKHQVHTPSNANNSTSMINTATSHTPKSQKPPPIANSIQQQKQSEGMRQQLLSVTKEKENLQLQLLNSKSEIEQLKDDYQTIVVQLQIAYEENKESIEETAKLNTTIEKMTKEKETMSAKIKDLQQLLLQTPVFDSSEKSGKRDLPEKLKKLGSSDSNSEDEGNDNESGNKKGGNKGKKKKGKKKDSDKDDSDDGDLNKTVLMYQTKMKNLMNEKVALYDNINKLADDNAHLKEQLNNMSTSPTAPTADQPYYIDQLKLLEEDQEYFAEELQRVWKSYDSLLVRLNSKSKDDSVYFENSKLHKENDKLHTKLIATRKEIQFLKDIRKSSVNSRNSKSVKNNVNSLNENDIEKIELRKKLDDERRKNEALVKALREEKAKTAANIVSEDEHRQLFNAKLTIHKLQYELQKVSSKFVHVKGKNKRLKLMMNEKGIQVVRDEMSNEIDAMRDAYESAIDWGYAQQEVAIKEQSEKEALLFRVKLLEENLKKDSKTGENSEVFDSHTEEVLAEMKSKIEEKLRLQHELDVIRELVVEQLNEEGDNANDSNLSTADLVEKVLQTNKKEKA